MEKFTSQTSDSDIVALRERIKAHYLTYHDRDRVKYPAFNFNTNRANYEPLRESFEEELLVRRGIDRQQKTIHIPSTNTLALLFTADGYVPDRKILDTCLLYAEGQSVANTPQSSQKASKPMYMILGVGAALLAVFFFIQYFHKSRSVTKLSISLPIGGREVPRLFPVEGSGTNADTVWVVVRPTGSPDYYVQAPSKVDSRGHWRGTIMIGSVHKHNIGKVFQIQAFTRPKNKLARGMILREWPEAELTSGIIQVVRGKELHASLTDNITFYKPFDGQDVHGETIIEGKAMNADTVWLVVHPEGNSHYWVRGRIKVEKNGRWRGKINIGDAYDPIGWPFAIRAFVRPIDALSPDDALLDWPKAQRSSGIIHVIRGSISR